MKFKQNIYNHVLQVDEFVYFYLERRRRCFPSLTFFSIAYESKLETNLVLGKIEHFKVLFVLFDINLKKNIIIKKKYIFLFF